MYPKLARDAEMPHKGIQRDMGRSTEDSIERALRIGEANQRVLELVRNWCAHLDVKREGGVGLVELETGLPIGMRSLDCVHARAHGFAGANLGNIALNFYDRNCMDCRFRRPVAVPNLQSLVDEREAGRVKQQAEEMLAQRELSDRLSKREAARLVIRRSVDALSAATLDHISELDRSRDDNARRKLVELAALAPETFPLPVAEHLFSLAESGEYWLIEPSLCALARLPVDMAQLCNVTLRVFAKGYVEHSMAEIVETYASLSDPHLICNALPALIQLANPRPVRFGIADRAQISPGALRACYEAAQQTVKDSLSTLIDRPDAEATDIACRGLELLAGRDPELPTIFIQALVSKLARAKWLVRRESEDVKEALKSVRDIVMQIFLLHPKECDEMICIYLQGATTEGALELHQVYLRTLEDRPVSGQAFENYGCTPDRVSTYHFCCNRF